MIVPRRPADTAAVGHHYDELDPFYRSLWGEHLHHGLWTTGRESPVEAALAMVDEVGARAGVGPGTTVCDVGCGYGATSRELVRRGARVIGITVSERQYRVATAGRPDGTETDGTDPRFLLRDWLDNGLADGGFDAVIAVESLSHMTSVPGALAEAFRVLRPGGRLVACAWLAAPAPRPWAVRHLLRPICEEGRIPGLPAATEYRRWLVEAGFEAVDVEDISERVARTWSICGWRVARTAAGPTGWRYLLDGRNRERRFAITVLRILLAYRTGSMRYGILTARKPAQPRGGPWKPDIC